MSATTSDTLGSLLAQGRAALAEQRQQSAAEEEERQASRQRAAQEHWQTLLDVLHQNVPACLLVHANLTPPQGWRGQDPCGCDSPTGEFDLEIVPPGSGAILGRFLHSNRDGWYQVKQGRPGTAWIVPTYQLWVGEGGQNYVRRSEWKESWYYVNELLIALALAEEEGQGKAALEAQAAERNQQREQLRAQYQPIPQAKPTLGEQLETLIRAIARDE